MCGQTERSRLCSEAAHARVGHAPPAQSSGFVLARLTFAVKGAQCRSQSFIHSFGHAGQEAASSSGQLKTRV